MFAAFDKRMAEAAVDLFYPGVYPVAEKDRLFRSEVLFWKKVIEI